ncbi:MAG: hypothetical protein ACR2PT_07865 [Endozoicomonas sp.]
MPASTETALLNKVILGKRTVIKVAKYKSHPEIYFISLFHSRYIRGSMKIPSFSYSFLLMLLVADCPSASLLEVSTLSLLFASRSNPVLTSPGLNDSATPDGCSETTFHLWSSDDSTRAGTAGIHLSFHYPVREVLHSEGSCDTLDIRSQRLLCRPGSDGYAWFRFNTVNCASHFPPVEHIHDDGWTVLMTESDSAGDLEIFLNGKSLKDPLNPDIDITSLEQPGAQSILQKIIEREREKEDIEAEVKAMGKALLDLLERVNSGFWRQSDLNPEKEMNERRKKRKRVAPQEKMQLAYRSRLTRQHLVPPDENDNYNFDDVKPIAPGVKIAFFLPRKRSRPNSETAPVDSEHDNGKQTVKQPPKVAIPASHRAARGMGRGEPKDKTKHQPGTDSSDMARARARGRGRGRVTEITQTQNKPYSPSVGISTSQNQPEVNENPEEVQAAGVSTTFKTGDTVHAEEQGKEMPNVVHHGEATLREDETQGIASTTEEALVKQKGDLDFLDLQYRYKKMKEAAYTFALEKVKDAISGLEQELASQRKSEDLRIPALRLYWSMLAVNVDPEQEEYAKNLKENKASYSSYDSGVWQPFFVEVLKWYDTGVRPEKKSH